MAVLVLLAFGTVFNLIWAYLWSDAPAEHLYRLLKILLPPLLFILLAVVVALLWLLYKLPGRENTKRAIRRVGGGILGAAAIGLVLWKTVPASSWKWLTEHFETLKLAGLALLVVFITIQLVRKRVIAISLPNWLLITFVMVVIPTFFIVGYRIMYPAEFQRWRDTGRSWWLVVLAVALVGPIVGYVGHQKRLKSLAVLATLVIGSYAIYGFVAEWLERRPRVKTSATMIIPGEETPRYHRYLKMIARTNEWSEPIVIPLGQGVDFQFREPLLAEVDGRELQNNNGQPLMIFPGVAGQFPAQAEQIRLKSAARDNVSVTVLYRYAR